MILLNDFTVSVKKAFSEIDPNWEKYPGYVICGTHSPGKETTEQYLKIIENCRLTHTPFLGICYGFQLAVIEYARNVLKEDTGTEELGATHFTVEKLSETRVGLKEVIDPLTLQPTKESHWHNYFVSERTMSAIQIKTLIEVPVLGRDWFLNYRCTDGIAEWFEIVFQIYEGNKRKPTFHMGVQFHPEYQSSKDNPHPLLVKFLENAKMAM